MSAPHRVFLVAAESSGDQLGAGLMEALREKLGEGVVFAGVGGPAMAQAGVASPFDYGDLSVVGLFDGVRIYKLVHRRIDETVALAAGFKPDVAVLIDSWGFTIRVAQRLREATPDAALVKYVAPQVWAARAGRAKALAASVDHLLTIHTFDAPYFQREGLATTFVGNPALERVPAGDGAAFRTRHKLGQDAPVLGVLFGSRASELRRLYAPFADAVGRLRAEQPDLRIVIPLSSQIADAARERLVADGRFAGATIVNEEEKADAFAACDLALACSGTVTTQLALAGVPAVVGYRLGWLTWAVFRALFLLKTKHISLVNIAAGEALMPEFIQTRCTGRLLANALRERLVDPQKRAHLSARLIAVSARMRGEGDADQKAATALIEILCARSGAQRLESGT